MAFTYKYHRIIGFILIFLMAISVSYGTSQDEVQTQIDQTKKKLSETKRKENTVLGSLLRTQQELEKINSSLSQLNSNLNTTERKMQIITAQLNSAEAELERIKTEIGGREGILDQRIVALYKHGYQSSLEVLFRAKNFAEFISRFEIIGSYVRGDLQIIKTLQAQQNMIKKKREEIAKKQQELAEQKNLYARLQIQTKQQQSRQLSAIEDKQQQLMILRNDVKALEEALDELELTSKAVEEQIRNYQLQFHNRPALGTGRYIWPAPGNITSYFGNRYHPVLRKRKFHSGIDIAAPAGTPIKASDSGVVIFADRNGGYGKFISIDHGNGISSCYAHCSIISVDQGQIVTKGDIIGKVGTTGLSTGPHLHFEIRKDGVTVDPLTYL
ncbi:MAG: peptidoglycan DD-metalloendopeptidase family protein [Firmicutes bacterium]|nr:peptidoglycan DD-metalloendopeptidase family protein [Bacillota bacterium]